MPVSPKLALRIVVASLAAIALPARADDRAQLNACQALIERAAQAAPNANGAKPDDAELQRCRQIVREWTLRDSRMSVDEQGRPLR
jgi:uncharacterized protein (DUF2345 family)